MKNILTITLSALKVRYTYQFANKLYRETSDRDNFFGLSFMLAMYGVESKGYNIEDKDLSQTQLPFIAHTNKGFMLVTDVNNVSVVCHDEKGKKSISRLLFEKSWTGNFLVIKSKPDSGEIDYDEHNRKEVMSALKKGVLVICCVFLLAIMLKMQLHEFTAIMLLYLALCILGALLSILLINKQSQSSSQLLDRLCSLISKSGCDAVAHSPGSKTVFEISWAEVGFGYFLSTILLLILIPECYMMLGTINIITLPYTIWSLWYQRKVIKKWCTLCILVQIILWSLFVLFCISAPPVSFFQPLHLLFIPLYGVTTVLIHNYSNRKEKIIEQENLVASYCTKLRRKEVFTRLLELQSFVKISNNYSNILIGNPSATTCLTIVSNPMCEPCKHTHRILDRLIKANVNIQVKYVFVSKDKAIDTASRYLIKSFLSYGDAFLNDWFNMTIDNRKQLITLMESNEIDENAEKEFLVHKDYIKNNNIKWTPTFIINSHIVPSIYSIEDLAYILFE